VLGCLTQRRGERGGERIKGMFFSVPLCLIFPDSGRGFELIA